MRLKCLDKNFDLNTDNFRKGMVLLDPENKIQPTMEFEVEALIVHHSSTIKVGYQSVVHCHVIRQTCIVTQMDKEFLRSGDKGIIRFKFIKKPEIMHVGDTILFREGRTRGKGKIIKIFPIDVDAMNKEKQNKKNKKIIKNDDENKYSININNNNEKKNDNNNKIKKHWKKKFIKNENDNKNNINNYEKNASSRKKEG